MDLLEYERNLLALTVAIEVKDASFANSKSLEYSLHILRTASDFPVDAEDDVEFIDTGQVSWAIDTHPRHDGATRIRESEVLRQAFGDIADLRDPRPSLTDLAVGADLGQEFPAGVDRNGEADSCRPYTLVTGNDEAVDSDYLAQAVDQRTAAVAAVDGGVRLDHVPVKFLALGLSEISVYPTDNTDTWRNSKGERIADSDRPFADQNIAGLTKGRNREVIGIHLENSQVNEVIGREVASLELASIRERNLQTAEAPGVADDVVVSQDVAPFGSFWTFPLR